MLSKRRCENIGWGIFLRSVLLAPGSMNSIGWPSCVIRPREDLVASDGLTSVLTEPRKAVQVAQLVSACQQSICHCKLCLVNRRERSLGGLARPKSTIPSQPELCQVLGDVEMLSGGYTICSQRHTWSSNAVRTNEGVNGVCE
jgi:hypothetical protein